MEKLKFVGFHGDDELLALELENLKELDFDIDELFSNIHDKDA